MVQKMLLWEGKENLVMSTDIRAKGSEIKFNIYFEAKVKDLSKKQMEFLEDLGGEKFTDNSGGKNISLSRLELKGIRLVSNSDLIKNKTDKFFSTGFIKKEYEEASIEDPTLPQIVGKILLTPFAVAVDILLAPIYFIGIIGAGIGSK